MEEPFLRHRHLFVFVKVFVVVVVVVVVEEPYRKLVGPLWNQNRYLKGSLTNTMVSSAQEPLGNK